MITATAFLQDVEALSVGKKLPEAIYLHRDTLAVENAPLYQFALAVANALKIDNNAWNIIKLSRRQFALSLLNYPSFYTDAYPALNSSISVDDCFQHEIVLHQKSNRFFDVSRFSSV